MLVMAATHGACTVGYGDMEILARLGDPPCGDCLRKPLTGEPEMCCSPVGRRLADDQSPGEAAGFHERHYLKRLGA